jgi:hypothetical protein
MRNRQAWIAAALTALSLLAALPAVAQEEEKEGVIAYLLAHPRILVNRLNLTPDQATATRQLIERTRTALRPLRTDIANLTKQIRDALAQPTPDACALGRLLVDRKAKYEQIEDVLQGFDDAFSALLTREQLARYEALKDVLGHGLPRD